MMFRAGYEESGFPIYLIIAQMCILFTDPEQVSVKYQKSNTEKVERFRIRLGGEMDHENVLLGLNGAEKHLKKRSGMLPRDL